MSAQNSSGIQTLLEAERKAHEIVQNARAYRAQRLKAAKTDAAAEIEEYKKQKEQEFKNSQSKDTGSTDQAEQEAEKAVKSDVENIQQQGKKAKDDVVKQMIDAVTSPKAELHINAKKA